MWFHLSGPVSDQTPPFPLYLVSVIPKIRRLEDSIDGEIRLHQDIFRTGLWFGFDEK